MTFKKLPDALASKITFTSDELDELPIDLKAYSPDKIFQEPDDAFKSAIALLEYKGIKKKTWKDLDAGIVVSYLVHANNEAYQPLTLDGAIKSLPEEFKGKDTPLTAGEKFELYHDYGEMSLEKLPNIDIAYDFLAKHRDLSDIDLTKLPPYAKDLFVAHTTMASYAVEKKDMLGLRDT